MQVNTWLKDMPDQLTALEENLATNLAVTLRDDNRQNAEQVLETLEDLEGKVHALKKTFKRNGGGAEGAVGGANAAAGGGGVGVSLDTLLDRVAGVVQRLEAVEAALEANIAERSGGVGGAGAEKSSSSSSSSLGLALVLAEVRKKADSESLDRLSQDMFKAVHNVQKRLLEEHVSLWRKRE